MVSCTSCVFAVLIPHRAESWRQSTSDDQVPCCRVFVFLCVIVVSCPCSLLFPSGQHPSSVKILILIFHSCCGLLSRLPLVLFSNMKPQTEPHGPATAERSRKFSVWVHLIWFSKYTSHCL